VGVRVAGPIIRDRLWYSAAYNPRIWRADREITGLGVFADEHMMHVFAAKASLRANAATSFEFSVFGDPATHNIVEPNGLFAGYTPLSADPYRVRFEAGSKVGVLRGTVVLSRFLLEASAARSTGKLYGIGGTDAAQNQPLFVDHAANTISGGIGAWSKADLARSSFVVRGTLTLGRHTTVIGAEYEDVSAFRDLGWTGGYLVETMSSGGFRAISEGAPGKFHNRVPTIYLQNSWRVADALTINTGLRWSAQTLTAASGGIAQRFPHEWQPRLGVIWQPGASRNDRLYASFGRSMCRSR
jgi:outer membrane receptor protein involved in Fe transport